MNNTQFDRVEASIKEVRAELKRMDKKLDMLLYDDDVEQPKELSEDDIYTKGQRVPYVKLTDDEQIHEFRGFLSYIRMNESFYTEREIEFASYADKTFDDIRLSENSKRILESAYFKTYKRNWPFKFIRGYLHKWNDQKGWSWADGKRD